VSDEHGVYCVNAQLCGFEGGKGFVGGSSVVDPFGQVLVQAPLLEDHLAVAPVDLDQIAIARSQIPLTSDLQSAWADIQRIVAGDE
jgi:predicted amidohydrolase